MDWIKKNPAQFSLALVATGVLASSFFLYQKVSEFPDTLTGGKSTPSANKEIPALGAEGIDTAGKEFTTPSLWKPTLEQGSLFVSDAYVLTEGKLVRPGDGMFHPPVPNSWLIKNGLDILNPNILTEDPDKDGFDNLLEFKGMDGKVAEPTDTGADSTDPNKADSHPPYHTRLQLAQVVNIPFRLRFMMLDEDRRNPANTTVQINTIDRGNRTMFVPLGEPIPGTDFKTVAARFKEAPGADGTKKEVSELDIVNSKTGQKLTLTLGIVTDSPESYLVLKYHWVAPGGQPTADMNLKKGQEFIIPPETDKKYKVVDIKATEAVIALPSGQEITLPVTR